MSADKIAGDLKKVLGPQAVFEDEAGRKECARDWWPQTLWWQENKIAAHTPDALIKPANAEELCRLLQWANDRGIAVVPRGGGSGVCGSAIPSNRESIVVKTERLNKVLGMADSAVTVEGGVLGGDLESYLNNRGWSLQHFPAALDISTAGGWIATGSFGQFSTLYGGIGDQAKKIEAALPDGRLVEVEPDDFILSEGTLGIVTKVTLKIRRLPEKYFSLSCEFGAISQGLDFVRYLIRSGIRPAVTRLYDPMEARAGGMARSKYRLINDEAEFKLRCCLLKHLNLVRFLRRLEDKIRSPRPWLLVMVLDETQAQEAEHLVKLLKNEPIKADEKAGEIWLAKRYQWNTDKIMALFNQGCFVDTLDTWAGWDRLGRIYQETMAAVSPYALVMGHISHFTGEGGCLYLIIAGRGANPQDSIYRHQTAWRLAMEACIKCGGLVNHHHGIGFAKLPWISHAYQNSRLDGLRARKKIYDPKGIMNPGKII